MLDSKKVYEIRFLLRQDRWSQREIWRRTGVSRATIAAIASGEYRLRPPKPIEEFDLPPERCPDCGGMVSMPCRACLVRRYQRRLRAAQRAALAQAQQPTAPSHCERPAA